MGSPAEAHYRKLVKRLRELDGVRERPEKPGTPIARASVKPTLWLQGKRFVVFEKDADKRLIARVRVPEGFAADVPDATRTLNGDPEVRADLTVKPEVARAEEVARFVHAGMTGKRVT